MKNRRVTYNQKKNKSKYIWIGSSVAVLILLGLGILYLYQDGVFGSKVSQNGEELKQNEEIPKVPEGDEKADTDKEHKVEEKSSGENEKQETEEQIEKRIEYKEGQKLPSEPTYIDGVLVVNKEYPLPKDFAPGVNPEAQKAFERMAADAKSVGYELEAYSSYRSFEYQDMLYTNYVNRDGQKNADRYSARPGYSEHQTGLSFDIGEIGREDLRLTEAFGETPAGKWLAENAHQYGFILRYPKGKEHITGYMYESWHFRYLGVELATKVKESNLTLEEYLKIN